MITVRGVATGAMARVQKMLALANDPAAADGERDNAQRMAESTLAKYSEPTEAQLVLAENELDQAWAAHKAYLKQNLVAHLAADHPLEVRLQRAQNRRYKCAAEHVQATRAPFTGPIALDCAGTWRIRVSLWSRGPVTDASVVISTRAKNHTGHWEMRHTMWLAELQKDEQAFTLVVNEHEDLALFFDPAEMRQACEVVIEPVVPPEKPLTVEQRLRALEGEKQPLAIGVE